ncbi:LOW QUALITY PROTEIN: protein phosphatase 1 regulatory subunit 12C [Polyodon spathula]|uniref:LOW QUALITY PROTEIN: protein phosphatase 1 regulatory subunit 12C n=1 Tax=Polyodon spathula TaxID=7913 RepID=UPI001B7E6941|nr:LOW QUALITY PROTEIN: protein phosphatase 1 regulatory subunit 12C [Polyodon spathula]
MADGGAGAAAKAKRREQLQRWSGSTTDRAPAAPRRRRRSESREQRRGGQEEEPGQGGGEAAAAGAGRGGGGGKRRKTRRSVRFERAAEFLAACACGDTEEAAEMLRECGSGAAGDEGAGAGEEEGVINSTNADGISALHQACIDENLEMVHFLVSHGAAVNQSDNEGWTPLHVTASCGLLEITEFLLQQGALVSAVNCDGDIPLDIAEDEAMERLLQDHVTKQGVDVAAVKREEEEMMLRDAQQWLLEGVPPNVCDPKTGASPLHVAAAKGYLEVMRLLLQCGFRHSLRDQDGWTPLHAAAHWGQGEVCRLLCEGLCAMEALSNTGQTPFDVADESVESLLEELKSKQAAIRSQNEAASEGQQQQGGPESNMEQPGSGSFKNRRSSVCRMSSKEKIWVQDQSKERKTLSGMSVGEGEGEEEEGEGGPTSEPGGGGDTSSPSVLIVSSPSPATPLSSGEPLAVNKVRLSRAAPVSRVSLCFYTPTGPGPTVWPLAVVFKFVHQVAAALHVNCSCLSDPMDCNVFVSVPPPRAPPPSPRLEPSYSPPRRPPPILRDEGLLTRLDSDPPSQSSLNLQPSPNSENLDRRKSYQTPVRDEESESQRKARSRLMRQSRRSTQGVTLTDLKEAEKTISRQGSQVEESDPIDQRSVQAVSPEIGGPCAERDVETPTSAEETNRARERRRGRRERRSTGLVQLSEREMEENEFLDQTDYKQERNAERPALLELERFERRSLERKAAELEEELKVLADLRADNQRLKDENAALIRVISKLSK